MNCEGQETGTNNDHEDCLPAFSQLTVFKHLEGSSQSLTFLALPNSKKVGVTGLGIHLTAVDEGR